MGTGPGKDRVLLRQPINIKQKDSHGQHGRNVSLVSLTLRYSSGERSTHIFYLSRSSNTAL